MVRIRAFLIDLAQILMVVSLVIGTVLGFIAGGSASGVFGDFSLGFAIVGAIVGFCVSGVGMSVLAILLDIREALLRLQAKGGI